jgi:hypothetical protein
MLIYKKMGVFIVDIFDKNFAGGRNNGKISYGWRAGSDPLSGSGRG